MPTELSQGFLRVFVIERTGLTPIENATLTIVYEETPDVEPREFTTDNSGQTPLVTLPAPPLEYSEAPDEPKPYADYTITVNKPGYEETIVSKGFIKTERTEESAFGEAAVQTYERKSREYVITGTAKVPYDFGDEEVLTAADVNKMTQDRQVMLAEVEKRYNERQANKAADGASFNAAAATKAAQAVPEGGFVF